MDVQIQSTIDKYANRPDRLDPEDWYHVEIKVDTKEQCDAVYEAASKLCKMGIGFDTGGCTGIRDWELDWSFNVHDSEDGDLKYGRKIVEDVLNGMEASKEIDDILNEVQHV